MSLLIFGNLVLLLMSKPFGVDPFILLPRFPGFVLIGLSLLSLPLF